MFLRLISSGTWSIGYSIQFNHGNICIPGVLLNVLHACLDSSRKVHRKPHYCALVTDRFKCMCDPGTVPAGPWAATLKWSSRLHFFLSLYFQNQFKVYLNAKINDSSSNKKQKRNQRPDLGWFKRLNFWWTVEQSWRQHYGPVVACFFALWEYSGHTLVEIKSLFPLFWIDVSLRPCTKFCGVLRRGTTYSQSSSG